MVQFIGFPILIRWILIYPVDSAVQCLNNQGLDYNHLDDHIPPTYEI